jgi:hypothetical protein
VTAQLLGGNKSSSWLGFSLFSSDMYRNTRVLLLTPFFLVFFLVFFSLFSKGNCSHLPSPRPIPPSAGECSLLWSSAPAGGASSPLGSSKRLYDSVHIYEKRETCTISIVLFLFNVRGPPYSRLPASRNVTISDLWLSGPLIVRNANRYKL